MRTQRIAKEWSELIWEKYWIAPGLVTGTMHRMSKSEDSGVTHRLLDWIFQRMLTTPTLLTSAWIATALPRFPCFFVLLKDYSTASWAPWLTCIESWKCLGTYVSTGWPWYCFITKDCTGMWTLGSLALRWHKSRDVMHTVPLGSGWGWIFYWNHTVAWLPLFHFPLSLSPLRVFSWEHFLTLRVVINFISESALAEPDPG